MSNIHLLKRLYIDDTFADTLQQFMQQHIALLREYKTATIERQKGIVKEIEQLRMVRETFIAEMGR